VVGVVVGLVALWVGARSAIREILWIERERWRQQVRVYWRVVNRIWFGLFCMDGTRVWIWRHAKAHVEGWNLRAPTFGFCYWPFLSRDLGVVWANIFIVFVISDMRSLDHLYVDCTSPRSVLGRRPCEDWVGEEGNSKIYVDEHL
jgi:hypothetical protein